MTLEIGKPYKLKRENFEVYKMSKAIPFPDEVLVVPVKLMSNYVECLVYWNANDVPFKDVKTKIFSSNDLDGLDPIEDKSFYKFWETITKMKTTVSIGLFD